jgi:hypothetical protein
MPRVVFSRHFAKHVDAQPGEVSGRTVAEALEAVFQRNPALRGYVRDDAGRIRQHVMVFVDDRYLADRQSQSDPVEAATAIYVMQALSGG